jgi:2-keto-3-deoxy-6-phosphogluconate aldolase
MADMGTAIRGGDGIAFLVSAGIVYEIIAAACSSPQTMEIIAAMVDRQHRAAIIAGGTTAGVLMYAQYAHAKKAGLASDAPGTESY